MPDPHNSVKADAPVCSECGGEGEIELAWLWAPDAPYDVIVCPACQPDPDTPEDE